MAKRPRAATQTQRAAPTTKRATGTKRAPEAKATTGMAEAESATKRKVITKAAKVESPAAKAKPSAAKPSIAKAKPSAAKRTPTKAEAGVARVGAAKAKAKAATKPAPTAGVRGASTAKATTKAASAPPSPKPRSRAAAKPKTTPRKSRKTPPLYLAAELGQPVDHEGEPIGAGSRAAFSDTELQKYTLQLWQQMQARRGVSLQIPAMERAGVTIDQIWTAGVTDRLTTSSTVDEMRRYKQKLLFRANLLESILTETVGELQRLNSVEPTPARPVGEAD